MSVEDWSRPLVTNTGKPAKQRPGAWGEHNGRSTQLVDIPSTDDCFYFFVDGTSYGDADHLTLRNATPAEILAHPDVWPDWQDWARENATMTHGPATYAKANPRPDLIPPTLQPATFDHVLAQVRATERAMMEEAAPKAPAIDRAAIVAAAKAINDEMVSAPQNEPEYWGHRLADKLGCPPDAPKVAPWEAAYIAWDMADDAENKEVWQAAIEWCAGQLSEALDDHPRCVLGLKSLRARIMGADA